MIGKQSFETTESMDYLNNYDASTFTKKTSLTRKRIIIILIFSIFLILLITFIIFLTFFSIKIKIQFRKHHKKTKKRHKKGKFKYMYGRRNYSIPIINMTKIYLYKDNPDKEMFFYQFLCPKQVINRTRIPIGGKVDGGYVMLDDFENITIAYSIGIDGNIQFDKALADKGIDVYMYDHTINKTYRNEKFHWKKIGIGGNSERKNNIQTLQEMMKENGHLKEKNMILKMDVEGAEWNSLDDLSENILQQFKYIVVEYHLYQIMIKKIYNVLRKIYKSHQVFYVHCNPFSYVRTFGNNTICDVIEVSYVIRTGYSFAKDESNYPIPELSYYDNRDFDVNILKLFYNYKPS